MGRGGGLWAVAALALAVGFFVGADPWDPLAGALGFAAVAAAAFGVGLVAGSWKAPLAALLFVPLAPLNRAEEPALYISIGIPALIFAAAVVIALGVGVRKLFDARRRSEFERRLRHAGACLSVAAIIATGWGVYLDHRVVDRSPRHPRLVDDSRGTFGRIRLGMSIERVRRLLGPGKPGNPDWAPAPVGMDPNALSGPGSMRDYRELRYRDLVVFARKGIVRGFVTTARDAQTQSGVGIGDSLAVAEQRYGDINCSGVLTGSDSSNPSYRGCQRPLAGGGAIWFGGDPIDSLWIFEKGGI